MCNGPRTLYSSVSTRTRPGAFFQLVRTEYLSLYLFLLLSESCLCCIEIDTMAEGSVTRLNITGMMCTKSCTPTVEAALREVRNIPLENGYDVERQRKEDNASFGRWRVWRM